MCGICGIIDIHEIQELKARNDLVLSMNKELFHRGPDGEGYYSDGLASLAMRRLAVIDVEGGDQPQFNEDKSVMVFLNGEIYNFKSLKKKLLAKGHVFTTNSDTEVIVHLYESYGEKLFSQLKGMFALCLYDRKKKKFLLGRDRFGEKPLYYHLKHEVLSFSSEIGSLLQNSWIRRILNKEALPYYLRTATVPEPMTMFKNIQSLPPGHYLKITKSGFQTKTYFRPDRQSSQVIENESEAIDFIAPKLRKAIKRQMVSDVPIGAFLSGGIDSSTVVAIMQQISSKPIPTFNVRFENQKFDESPIARKVAEYCGTDHHQITIPNAKFTESLFWEILDHIGLPFRDSSAIPTYLIAQKISKHVKVALSGDGGDELFGGYDIFQWYSRILKIQQVPQPFRSAGNSIVSALQKAPFLNQSSKLRQIKRGIQSSLSHKAVLPVILSEMFSKTEVDELTDSANDFARYSPFTLNPYGDSDLRNIMYYRLMHVLPVNMLTKVDRMSMSHSLEVRTPFLDIDLFQASLEIPDHLLISNGKGKQLIRKIMKDSLPEEVFNHKKTGFNLPLHSYMNEEFENLANDLLFVNNPWPGFFKKDLLRNIYQIGIKQDRDNALKSTYRTSHQLWMMMQLLGWARRFKIEVA